MLINGIRTNFRILKTLISYDHGYLISFFPVHRHLGPEKIIIILFPNALDLRATCGMYIKTSENKLITKHLKK